MKWQTNREADMQKSRQTDRQVTALTSIQTGGVAYQLSQTEALHTSIDMNKRQIYRQALRHIDRQTERQTDIQSDRQTDRQK